jgi:hypothetical protein
MKIVLTVATLFCLLTSCKKMIEAAQEDLVIKAMVDGQWKVTQFKKGSVDVTSEFSPYLFQFRADKTVEAIKSGSTESKGVWNGNATERTITSSFSNAASTIMLLNGTWQITKNSWTYVEAMQTVNSEVLTLRLDK